MRIRSILQVLALALALGALGFWLVTGAHRGWTRTMVPMKTLDEVTGIEGIQYRKQFVPGVDFLGAALLGAGALGILSFFFRSRSQHQPQSQT